MCLTVIKLDAYTVFTILHIECHKGMKGLLKNNKRRVQSNDTKKGNERGKRNEETIEK